MRQFLCVTGFCQRYGDKMMAQGKPDFIRGKITLRADQYNRIPRSFAHLNQLFTVGFFAMGNEKIRIR